MTFRFILVGLFSLLLGTAAAQAIRIGVVVDRTGPTATAATNAVLELFQSQMDRSGGVFGTPVEVLVRDDRGDPFHAREQVQALIEEHQVHALVCCMSVSSAEAIMDLSDTANALVLALTSPPTADAGWLYGLAANERAELRSIVSHAYAEGKFTLALMTLDNSFGDLPARVLEEELGVAGMRLAAVERYSPSATVLTPEALWVATRQPGAIVVWGLPQDSMVAVDALRRRGYEGPIYARGSLAGTFSGSVVRLPVTPIEVDDAVGDRLAALEPAAALEDALLGLYGIRDVPPDAARLYDALTLLVAAAEQVAQYGVAPDSVASYRLALRDAAIALPTFPGAAGEYDLDEESNQAALPGGLVVAHVQGGRLVRVSP